MEISNQDKAKLIKTMCKENYLYFMENFLKMVQFDTVGEGEAIIPMKLFDYQKEYLHELNLAYIGRYDLGVRKSRKAGYSWVTSGWVFWRWLFYKDFHCLMGSHKEDTLDKKGEPDTLMGKIDVFIQHTPEWLMPKGFDYKRDRIQFHIKNPETKSLIKGETSVQNFARSGRYSMILMDECAFWENLDLSLKSSASASKCRVIGSSYNGYNEFQQTVNSGNIKTFDMNWERNPLYNKDMYFDEDSGLMTSPEIEREKKRYISSGLGIKGFMEEIYMKPVKEGSSVFNMEKTNVVENTQPHPISGDVYSVGVDVAAASGYNVDKQVIVVESKLTGETVFFWEGNLPMEKLAWKIIGVANRFNKALVVIESNRGQGLIEIISKFYKKLYRKECLDSVTNKRSLKIGYNMNGKTKEPAVLSLQSEIEAGNKKICHYEIKEQLDTYADLGSGKYGAPSKSFHDDRVVGYILSNIGIQSNQCGSAKTAEDLFKEEQKKKNKVKIYRSNSCAY